MRSLRYTIQGLILAVALVAGVVTFGYPAVDSWCFQRSQELAALADLHAFKEATTWTETIAHGPRGSFVTRQPDELTRYHAMLKRKYRRASLEPWWPVPIDAPPPH